METLINGGYLVTYVIGLTGGIASGKSTVSKMFRSRGIRVIDADLISRDVVEVGRPAYHQICETFGEEILHKDRTINREKLGGIIFTDEKKRKQLNNIVHPAVREEMLKQTQEEKDKQAKVVVLDIPLLFESKLAYLVDRTVLVYVNEGTQLERLMERNGYQRSEAMSRISSQIPLKEKLTMADNVIDNNGRIEETESQLQGLLRELI